MELLVKDIDHNFSKKLMDIESTIDDNKNTLLETSNKV